MAVSAATQTSDFSGFLTPEMAAPIFNEAAHMSAVMSIARQVPLGINGQTIPVLTDDIDAGWVGEGTTKPASNMSLTLKTITPKKVAAIAVVSAEVARANPGGYVDLIRPRLAGAFARAFDSAVLHGTNTPFAAYLDQTEKAVELGSSTSAIGGVWADLNNALQLLANDRKRLTGFVFDDIMEPTLNASVDSNGRPIFVDTPLSETNPAAGGDSDAARRGRVMGRQTYMNRYIATDDLDTVVGYAGDWTKAVWGVVGGINFDISDQAAITINGSLVSLFENNLIAIRAEAEYGFVVEDVDYFVRLRNLTGS